MQLRNWLAGSQTPEELVSALDAIGALWDITPCNLTPQRGAALARPMCRGTETIPPPSRLCENVCALIDQALRSAVVYFHHLAKHGELSRNLLRLLQWTKITRPCKQTSPICLCSSGRGYIRHSFTRTPLSPPRSKQIRKDTLPPD